MLNNPYIILEIERDATDLEIREAVINQIRKYCKDNHQDNKYLIEIFSNAGVQLLDSIKRKEIDGLLYKEEKQIQNTDLSSKQEKINQDLEETKDVRGTFICVYDENQVGLFKRINYSTRGSSSSYDAYNIYEGIDSDYIGIEQLHDGSIDYHLWNGIGTRVVVRDDKYVANCNMYKSIHFEDMRLIMYQDQKIGPYERGRATSKEILDTLCYAKDYYQMNSKGKSYQK